MAWTAGIVAAIAVVLTVQVVRRICTRFGFYDLPGPLKIHTQPVPRLGGMAIVIGIAVSVLFAGRSSEVFAWQFFAALAFVWIAGLIDDLRGLRPALRLAAQAGAALLLWRGGPSPIFSADNLFTLTGTCLFVILFVNAFNFLDGSDGIAAGVTAVIAVGYILLPGGAHSSFGEAVAWSLFGACAGFLVFNFPPAKIFMGDSGSTVLGLAIAFLGVDYYHSAPKPGPASLFPFLVAALPLLDALLVLFRRVQTRRPAFSGDRFHFYDFLLARGWSPRIVVGWAYTVTAALVLAGLLLARGSTTFLFWSAGAIAGALLVATLRLASLPRTVPNQGIQQESEQPRSREIAEF